MTKSLSYPLYPPHLARRRFSDTRHTFHGGHRYITRPKSSRTGASSSEAAPSSLLGSPPPLAFVTLQPKWNPKNRTTKRNATILISETQEGNLFIHFFLRFSCATSTLHPHTHGQARTEGRRDGRRDGERETEREGFVQDKQLPERHCAWLNKEPKLLPRWGSGGRGWLGGGKGGGGRVACRSQS